MTDQYIAHFYEEDDIVYIQSVSTHNHNVASLASTNSPLPNLTTIAWLCGILHDAGKYGSDFQDYIKGAMNGEDVQPGKVTHSTAGGCLMEQLLPESKMSQMIQMSVLSHHGMNDSFSIVNSTIFIEERLKKQKNIREIQNYYFQFINEENLKEMCDKADQDMKNILGEILRFFKKYSREKNRYGNRHFFLGMYERVLFSLLIDADRTDTACFMQDRKLPEVKSNEEIEGVWKKSIIHFEKYLKEFKGKSRLDTYRREISSKCMEAGGKSDSLYRLTVPTGAGKTLSSLRFALYHAAKYGKRHIIYVAPFQSILDQNAEVIRKAVGNPEIVLEHHCNVVHDDADKKEKYELLTENWDSPIIVTTAVQFLNTLFAAGNGNIRRMYNILNSVIIFDEVQSLPIKITKMYNLAVNFLTAFGKSTVVLCSATQPLFDELGENGLLPPVNMVGDAGTYAEAFKRTEIIDATEGIGAGFSVEDLRDFIWDKAEKAEQILVVVNTKACAHKIYEELKDQCAEKGYLLFHLSTNMCARNRREVLASIEKSLTGSRKLICVSTQLIEAGVDLSFQCVIRSLAGLDSIVQAAGRCNRHGEKEMGYVYIVQMSKEAEDVDSLIDIRKAQESMRQVLYQLRIQPETYHSLSSELAIRLYYKIYLRSRKSEMEFPVSVNGVSTTLLDLLSGNDKLWQGMPQAVRNQHGNLLLKQAFKTAGDLFEVIPEDGKIDVIVRYDEEADQQIDILENPYITVEEKKQAIRRLQPYTVGISEALRQRLGNAVRAICDGSILILSDNYYSKETGVSEKPVGMGFLNY